MPSITREVLEKRATPYSDQKQNKRRLIGCITLCFSLGIISDLDQLPPEARNLIVAVIEFLRFLGF